MKLDRLAVRAPLAGLAAALLLTLGGCATTGGPRNPRDPWEPFNRHVNDFNEGVDRIVLRPSATWYRDKVPPLVRTSVSNFFGNLGDAWSAVNSLLQFRLHDFGDNLARVQVNTVMGFFGLFDVASEFNIERHREDFGQTLGRWGIPAGPYVVLPLLGPSTLRDTVALPVDAHYDLVSRINPAGTRDMTYVLRVVDKRSNLLRVGNVLEEAALDKYSFTRDAYLQRRRAEVNDYRNGNEPPPPALPDESKEPAESQTAQPAQPAASRPAPAAAQPAQPAASQPAAAQPAQPAASQPAPPAAGQPARPPEH